MLMTVTDMAPYTISPKMARASTLEFQLEVNLRIHGKP